MKDKLIKLKRWVGSIPHLFSKTIVAICIFMGIRHTEMAMQVVRDTGAEPSMTLAASLAFFGGELLFLCLKTIKGGKDAAESEETDDV